MMVLPTFTQDGRNMHVIADAMLQNSPRALERGRKIVRELGVEGHKLSTRVERVNCGKKCSKCPHGPYLYAYWKQDGKTKSKYIGKVGR